MHLKAKIERKNGNQKTHRNDCEQSIDGTETQERREDYEQSFTCDNREIKEMTDTQVKEAAGKASVCMRRENENKENKMRKK